MKSAASFRIFLLVILPLFSQAQADIPINSWRLHPSFNAVTHITFNKNLQVYASAEHGIILLDRADNSVKTFTTLDALKASTITSIEFDTHSQILLISYADGTFDVMDNNIISAFDPTANASLTGSKKINDIIFNDNLAYLSTDYGVVVFDVLKRQIKETWRDLNEEGDVLKIYECTLRGDSVFLATENGVLAGSINSNLQDFAKWKRYNEDDLAGPIKALTIFDEAVYCAIDSKGVYKLEDGKWSIQSYLQGQQFNSLTALSGSLIVATAESLWRVSNDGSATQLLTTSIIRPNYAAEDSEGRIWIGDAVSGLLSESDQGTRSYLPNSPANQQLSRLRVHQNKLYGVSGGHLQVTTSSGNSTIDIFDNGLWASTSSALSNVSDILVTHNTDELYIASYGGGIEVRNGTENSLIWNEENSTLTNVNTPEKSINISALAYNEDGLWVTNYGSNQPLHLLKSDKTWQAFSFPEIATHYPTQMITDLSGNVWMLIDPSKGGGVVVFNKEQNAIRYLTNVEGQGGLPAKEAYGIAIDREGLIWVGTELGAAYFNASSSVFSGAVNAVKPVVDGRFLLRDDRVTSIAIDGGNRKWFGTQRGVWLYSSAGDMAIQNFTTDNSPLPSNSIVDIAINDANGEVFFSTTQGLASYRSGSTTANGEEPLKIFPNPVYPDFVGTVGISGTPTDAIVKITDVSGKLVWQTRANGSTATWNVQDNAGRRVPTGVYIVFIVTDGGEQKLVSKIAVVD